jgi:NAD(P)-dependent dehydrogenase (short-subunit alcohol dehydrogenase family)
MLKDLINKTIIITGGAGFLGKQFSDAFLECQANVVALDIKNLKKNFIKSNLNNKNFYFIKCDITKESDVKRSAFKILKKFKKIDVLINNASNDYKPKKKNENKFLLENFNLKIWEKDLNVGLKGALICSKIFGKYISNNKSGGSIINVASDLGIIAPDQRIYKKFNFVKPVTYSVIKHGIIGLTRYIATYWAPKNVRCNALAPGGMYNYHDKKFVNEIKKLIPLNRMAKLKEYNGAILFLASQNSSYITGSTLVVDGGRTTW